MTGRKQGNPAGGRFLQPQVGRVLHAGKPPRSRHSRGSTRVNGKMGSSTRGRKRSVCKRLPLLHLDTRELHHLSPFLGFLGDELGEVGWRAGKYFTAEFG